MLILINVDIVVIALDLMDVHDFYCRMTNRIRNVVYFTADNNSCSMHAHNRKNDILFLGEGSTVKLDDNSTTVETKYSNDITKSKNGDEATDFQSRKLPETAANYNCWSVILIDFVLKKLIHKCFQKNSSVFKYIEKEEK